MKVNLIFFLTIFLLLFSLNYSNDLKISSASGPWTPDNLSNLLLWLDADDATTVTNSSGVSAWDDKSGAGNSVSQGTLANRPSYESAVLNGKNIVRFNGTSHFLTGSLNLTGNPNIAIIAVLKAPNLATYQSAVRFQSDGSSYVVYPWGASRVFISSNDGGTSGISTGLVANEWNIGVATREINDAAGMKTWRNGTFVTSKSTTNTNVVSGALFLGRYASGGEYFNGDMAEVLVYNTSISESDRQKLEGYLAHKWGMENDLPAGHPYENSPPMLPSGTGMQSSNYTIQFDSINFGGGLSTSSSFSLEDTMGEIGTGESDSLNYEMRAGYQQMNDSFISISAPSLVDLGSLSGFSGGTATGSATVNVTTDSFGGYQLTTNASTDPAMTSASSQFDDYSPGGPDPDYSFDLDTNESLFGFAVSGTDIIQRYKNNTTVCNAGGNTTAETCWDGFSLTPQMISQKHSSNHPTGTDTEVYFRAGIGSNKLQESGSYEANITFTATAL